MTDTLGTLIDKLITVDMKMWYAQEDFYRIRHMTLKEFKIEFFNDSGMEKLWTAFKKGIDLNLQRNQLIFEIDSELSRILEKDYGNDPHKTY